MTNKEYLRSLSKEEQKAYLEMYNRHPLYDYIDWKAFSESEDRDETHFVNNLGTKVIEDQEFLLLERKVIDGIDYYKAFCFNDNSFYDVPSGESIEEIEAKIRKEVYDSVPVAEGETVYAIISKAGSLTIAPVPFQKSLLVKGEKMWGVCLFATEEEAKAEIRNRMKP